MTNLHRIIGYLAATLVELALAGAWGAAPTVVLDIPTPTATRMTPCPVHAGINIASSSTGDSSSWDQCRIMWQLEADGSALDDWPSKYRYVTDPRPGLNSKQIDLAGQTDTDNFNRPRGFNFGWVLTAGTWRVRCTVTNPEGLSTTTTSSDIVIAANTRTQYTVQSAGGDYTTLAACLADDPGTTGTVIAGRNDTEIVVEDGHTETITAALTAVTGDNFYIRQAGTGTRPLISWNGDLSGGSTAILDTRGENSVGEGISMQDIAGLVVTQSDDVAAFRNWDTGAFVNCHCNGNSGANRLMQAFFGNSNIFGFVILKCSTDYTRGYSSVNQSNQSMQKFTIVGCNFGPSSNESVIRSVGVPDFYNVCWCDLTQNGSKSSLRLVGGDYMHAYGNEWTDGDNSTGWIAGDNAINFLRTEANYGSGTVSATALMAGITEEVQYATVCNNIVTSNIDAYMSLGNGASSAGTHIKADMKFAHNTVRGEDGYTGVYWIGGTSNGQATHSNNRAAANLMTHDDPVDSSSYYLDIGDDIADFANNVFPSTNSLTQFARVYTSSSTTRNVTDLAAFNSETWASGNTQADVTIDSRYEPSSPTTVATETGVFDDYYGNPRAATSYVGAVIASPTSTKRVMVLQ